MSELPQMASLFERLRSLLEAHSRLLRPAKLHVSDAHNILETDRAIAGHGRSLGLRRQVRWHVKGLPKRVELRARIFDQLSRTQRVRSWLSPLTNRPRIPRSQRVPAARPICFKGNLVLSSRDNPSALRRPCLASGQTPSSTRARVAEIRRDFFVCDPNFRRPATRVSADLTHR